MIYISKKKKKNSFIRHITSIVYLLYSFLVLLTISIFRLSFQERNFLNCISGFYDKMIELNICINNNNNLNNINNINNINNNNNYNNINNINIINNINNNNINNINNNNNINNINNNNNLNQPRNNNEVNSNQRINNNNNQIIIHNHINSFRENNQEEARNKIDNIHNEINNNLINNIDDQKGSQSNRSNSEILRINDKSPCIICITIPSQIILAPCGHRCLCLECYQKIKSIIKECPICKKIIISFVENIYDS